jgi:glyoxalase-like protein
LRVELDHLFCFVDPSGDWAARATAAGYVLDDGIAHDGQGTRNRRLWFGQHYVELVWIDRPDDAATNELRLDLRRCPFGIGIRTPALDAELRAACWAYRPPYAPDATIWIHAATPEQPFVFAFERGGERRPVPPHLLNAGGILRARLALPVDAQPVLARMTPPFELVRGAPRLELVVDGSPVELCRELVFVAR